ncbi:hypothetical protein [Sinimarinibacterium sp. NLF-5-8]|uniref:hypothetical protein n=1 Tax=Sinimarinibacterium sp. NLF-5-8 TaxID=2698684 RepID=UPI001EE4C09B|nr:hypothetical protein [Sinimarinibacterium sp. NLF-5-8]
MFSAVACRIQIQKNHCRINALIAINKVLATFPSTQDFPTAKNPAKTARHERRVPLKPPSNTITGGCTMARKPKKAAKAQAQPEAQKTNDDFIDDDELGDEEIIDFDESQIQTDIKMRDWRDVERLKEERALRKAIDDDFDF